LEQISPYEQPKTGFLNGAVPLRENYIKSGRGVNYKVLKIILPELELKIPAVYVI
jgi:hypothetical protein